MKPRLVTLLFCLAALCASAFAGDREVAITIDDLPAGYSDVPAPAIAEMNAKLVAALQQQKIPAVGFVNEKKLYHWGEVDQRIKALATWVDAGFELGNHTFSHASLNQVGLKAWEDDIIQGETVTRTLLAQHKMTLRYFRHPYLDTGRDLLTRQQADAFLTQRGYRIAPVTLDAWDWMYGAIYEDAMRRRDTALQAEMVRAYLAHSDAVFSYCEKQSLDLLGYEPKQVLLLHANWLEADHIAELADLLRKHGYKFIPLQDALSDQAYGQSDTFIGEEGSSWLDHWAITRGRPPLGFPDVPPDIQQRWDAVPNKPQ